MAARHHRLLGKHGASVCHTGNGCERFLCMAVRYVFHGQLRVHDDVELLRSGLPVELH